MSDFEAKMRLSQKTNKILALETRLNQKDLRLLEKDAIHKQELSALKSALGRKDSLLDDSHAQVEALQERVRTITLRNSGTESDLQRKVRTQLKQIGSLRQLVGQLENAIQRSTKSSALAKDEYERSARSRSEEIVQLKVKLLEARHQATQLENEAGDREAQNQAIQVSTSNRLDELRDALASAEEDAARWKQRCRELKIAQKKSDKREARMSSRILRLETALEEQNDKETLIRTRELQLNHRAKDLDRCREELEQCLNHADIAGQIRRELQHEHSSEVRVLMNSLQKCQQKLKRLRAQQRLSEMDTTQEKLVRQRLFRTALKLQYSFYGLRRQIEGFLSGDAADGFVDEGIDESAFKSTLVAGSKPSTQDADAFADELAQTVRDVAELRATLSNAYAQRLGTQCGVQ